MTSIRDFILGLEGQQKVIITALDTLLTSQLDLQGRIRFKIPMYYRKSWVCYLNPIKNNGVELAFMRGNELSNEQGLLEFRGRKQVAGIELFSLQDIPDQPLNELLQEALLLDETVKYNVRKKKT